MSNDSSDPRPALTQDLPKQGYTWSSVTALAILVAAFLIIPTTVQVVLFLVPGFFGWNSEQIEAWTNTAPLAAFLFVLCTEILTIGSLLGFVRMRHMSFCQVMGLGRPRWRDIGYAVLGLLIYFGIFMVVFAIATYLFSIDTDQKQALGFDRDVQGPGLWLAFASLVILPPIAEEIAFRGFLYGTLRGNRVKKWAAIFITSLIFAALHLFGAASGGLLWAAFVDVFVLSLVLCYLREQNGTIWASMGVHALKNGFVFFNLFIIQGR